MISIKKFYENWKSNFKFSGESVLFLVRGLPGSGKSTFCSMLRNDFHTLILEPDSFITKGGEYLYNKISFNLAVEVCKSIVMKNHKSMDICYCDVLPRIADVEDIINCTSRKTQIEVIDLPLISKTISKKRNIHNVTDEDINRMINTWESWSDQPII